MKKFILCMAAAVAFAFGFTSCGSKGTCGLCAKENVSVTKVKVDGEEIKLCKDCNELYKSIEKAAKEMEKAGITMDDSDFDLGDLDLSGLDFADYDLGDFDLPDYDLDDYEFTDEDLADLEEALKGLGDLF